MMTFDMINDDDNHDDDEMLGGTTDTWTLALFLYWYRKLHVNNAKPTDRFFFHRRPGGGKREIGYIENGKQSGH